MEPGGSQLTGNSSRSIESTDPSIPRPRHRADSTALTVKRLVLPRFNGRPRCSEGAPPARLYLERRETLCPNSAFTCQVSSAPVWQVISFHNGEFGNDRAVKPGVSRLAVSS